MPETRRGERTVRVMTHEAFPIDVGVDIDGCLYPYDEVMRAWATSATGQSLAPAEDRSAWRGWEMDEESYWAMHRYGAQSGVVYGMGAPDPDLLGALRRIADAGHRIHLLSARVGFVEDAWAVTRQWLWRWGVPHETLHVVAGSKRAVALDLGVRVVLDDDPRQAIELTGVGRVLVWAKPWNAEWDGERITDGWQLEEAVRAESRRVGEYPG
jgi:hypothetical protein